MHGNQAGRKGQRKGGRKGDLPGGTKGTFGKGGLKGICERRGKRRRRKSILSCMEVLLSPQEGKSLSVLPFPASFLPSWA